MNITKEWAMPNKLTFSIKPISRFVSQWLSDYMHNSEDGFLSVDPFANKNRIANVTNDLDPEMECDYCMDALEFLKTFSDCSVDFLLFDPPYSPRQVSECYKRLGKTVNMETTQSSFWSKMKNEISRIMKPQGLVLSFGWNSQGIGKTRGFEMVEILLVAHGGQHNDTICTAELKKYKQTSLDLIDKYNKVEE